MTPASAAKATANTTMRKRSGDQKSTDVRSCRFIKSADRVACSASSVGAFVRSHYQGVPPARKTKLRDVSKAKVMDAGAKHPRPSPLAPPQLVCGLRPPGRLMTRARGLLRLRGGAQRGFDGRLETFVRGVCDAATVEEDGRGAVDPEAVAVVQVATNALRELAGVERGVELRAVEPDARGVLLQLLRLQGGLVLEEQRRVLPVLALL